MDGANKFGVFQGRELRATFDTVEEAIEFGVECVSAWRRRSQQGEDAGSSRFSVLELEPVLG